MSKKKETIYNPYFFIPFILWMVIGSLLLAAYSNTDLFVAINGHYTDSLNTVMYYTTILGQGEIIVTVLLGALLFRRFRNWWYFLTALLCNIIPFFVQQWLKAIFNSPRPLNYYHHAEWMHWDNKWPYLTENSFPSGHSAGAFSFFCFLALMLPKKHRQWGLLFFVLALAVGYSRVYLAAHFFADVYAGSVLGTVITTCIFVVMTKYKSRFFAKKGHEGHTHHA